MKSFIDKIKLFHNLYIKNKSFIKRKSYSQDGEDLIINEKFKNIKKGIYIDVGCYHPLEISNTALLHHRGWSGINVDISKFSIKLFNFYRPNDLNLNFAVSNKNKIIEFYSQKSLSKITTIKKRISRNIFQGKIKKTKIVSKTLTKILDESKYKDKTIHFLNIDAEGSDFDVLKSLNFKKYKPKMICIEIFPKHGDFSKFNLKNNKIYKFLIKKKYKIKWSGYFSHIFMV